MTASQKDIMTMKANAYDKTDEELEAELFAAESPGNDEYAIAWLQVLKDEQAFRSAS